jgi:hypothetical protein
VKSLIVTFFIASVMSVSGMAQYKLEYKSSGSTPLHYKASTTVESVQTMMGQEAKFSMAINQSLTVTSAKADNELIYSMKVDSGISITVLPNGDTNRTTSPVLGKTRETHIRPNGEELSTRWVDSAFANTPAGQMKELGSFFFKLPSASIDTGATWSQKKTDTVATPGANGKIVVVTNTDYKLVGKEDFAGTTCAKIQYTGKITMKGAASAQGMDFAIDGSGTITGVALFDYSAGKVMRISGASDQDLVMASSGENAATIPMSQKMSYDLFFTK